MSSPSVVFFTDPAWALDAGGGVDPARASIERQIFGSDVELRFGLRLDGAYVTSGPEFLERARGADAVVIYRAQVTPELLEAAGDRCRIVARQGVGIDNLNAGLLGERGLYGIYVPDYCVDEVSTHTLALILAAERNVARHDACIKADRWSIHGPGVPRRMSELSLGIVGFGRIGRAVVRKAAPFFRTVEAYDPAVTADLMEGYGAVPRSSLKELLASVDVVTLHASLDPASEDLLNSSSLAALKPGATVVNAARGRLVDQAAMLTALEAGDVRAYAFDVFHPEDPNETEVGRALLGHDNVLATGHCAFLSEQSEHSARERIASEVAHVLTTGEPPRHGRVV